MKKFIVSVICAAVMAASASAGFSFADDTQAAPETQTQSEDLSSAETPAMTAEITASNSRADGDPLSQTEEKEIPLSFYIGGGVMAVFILASIVVLIIGKSKKND